jgi:thymidine kinase
LLAHVVLIKQSLSRDFIYPKECDEVSLFLRELAKTLSLKQEYIYLEFAFKKKILALANQIDEFRTICRSDNLHVESERRNILSNMENLFEKLNDIQKA